MARQVQQAQASAANRRGGPAMKIGTVLLLLPVLGFLLPTCVVLVITMAPTVVAYMVDRAREKYLAITVGLLNFCGALPAVAELWSHGQSYAAAMEISTDALSWLASYGAAALGWLIYGLLPPVLSGYYTMTSEARLQSLRRQQEQLIRAWGEDVAGDEQEAGPG
ncbi:MAG: hypothetical protein ACE5KF_02255 [Kiloniellaceae bacterium]